ncbi:DUF2783 domain-containing protein [Roseovarius phycicola]|uniref:DUF2783 domain-containing protein n=1 Tax=Roseovarius phycicola TaxID=3080976 RepID=A0ABZ2HJY6_9RHOB
MTKLILTPNLPNADDVYADILAAHDGLAFEESAALNARLILILANHIGDADLIRDALKEALA